MQLISTRQMEINRNITCHTTFKSFNPTLIKGGDSYLGQDK
jgi:hypothetical protein